MLFKEVKAFLQESGDLRHLQKFDNEVQITDIFINGDGLLRMETYSSVEIPHNEEALENIYDYLALHIILEEPFEFDNCEEEIDGFDYLLNILSGFDLDRIKKVNHSNYNKTVIEFDKSHLDELLFKASFN